MNLFLRIAGGHSADGVLINDVVKYSRMFEGTYFITYKDKGELFDIIVKHVVEIKEVK